MWDYLKSFKISARNHDIVVTITDKENGAKKNADKYSQDFRGQSNNIIKRCPISESVDSSIQYFRQLWTEIMKNNEKDTSSSIAPI